MYEMYLCCCFFIIIAHEISYTMVFTDPFVIKISGCTLSSEFCHKCQ